jgi:signal peptidase II
MWCWIFLIVRLSLQNIPKQDFLFKTSTLLFFSVLIVILDQLSKYLCDTYLSYGQAQRVFPGFDLLLVYNSGAAFSFLSDAGGWQRWFFTVLSFAISCLILVWLIKIPRREKLLALALCLILGGAVGNLIDRLLHGYVVDFISLYFQQYRFATFNIADSAISIGALLIGLEVIAGKVESKTNSGTHAE